MVKFAKEERMASAEDMIRMLLNRVEILEAKLEMLTKRKAEEQEKANDEILNEWMNGDENGN